MTSYGVTCDSRFYSYCFLDDLMPRKLEVWLKRAQFLRVPVSEQLTELIRASIESRDLNDSIYSQIQCCLFKPKCITLDMSTVYTLYMRQCVVATMCHCALRNNLDCQFLDFFIRQRLICIHSLGISSSPYHHSS